MIALDQGFLVVIGFLLRPESFWHILANSAINSVPRSNTIRCGSVGNESKPSFLGDICNFYSRLWQDQSLWDTIIWANFFTKRSGESCKSNPLPVSCEIAEALYYITAIEIADYDQANREVSPTMMMWPTLKSYSIQMSALSGTSDPTDIVPIKSSMPMTKFLEYFRLHLSTIVGLRKCPLDYVIPWRPSSFQMNHTLRKTDQSRESSEPVPLFRNDSAKVFQELSKGLVGSKYAATRRSSDLSCVHKSIYITEASNCSSIFWSR